MEEEFQGGVCGGNWWNSSRNLINSSPCSAAVNDPGWLNPSLIVDVDDLKTAKSMSDDRHSAASSDGGSSVVLQETQHKPQAQLSTNGNNMPIDSSLQMMADDWSQDLLHDSAKSHQNYSHMLQLQAMNSSMNCRPKIAEDDWTTSDFSADSSTNSFKPSFLSPPPNSFTSSTGLPSPASGHFPLNSASYSYTSSLLQTLFDADSQPQQPLLDNEAATTTNIYPSFGMNSTGVVLPTSCKASFPKFDTNSQFINYNTPVFWNATAAASSGDVRASFLPSSTPQLLPSCLSKPKLNQKNFSAKHNNEKSGEANGTAKKSGNNEPSFKRPRIETPSPLPTFKVRKEKLGDRVTALQQLVSPFGKTDTASVLHEAIEYIKLLHDQVTVLSTPYLKNGPLQLQSRQQAFDKINNQEEPVKDLRSRGLCLVPISSTFPVATETTHDFWTPTFGTSFK